MTIVSLWDTPQPAPPAPKVEKKPEVEPVKEVKQPVTVKQEVEKVQKEPQYYILAGTNKNGRQLFLFGYQDCMDYSISVVPAHFSYDRCKRLVAKAERELSNKKDVFGREINVPEFQIVPEEGVKEIVGSWYR